MSEIIFNTLNLIEACFSFLAYTPVLVYNSLESSNEQILTLANISLSLTSLYVTLLLFCCLMHKTIGSSFIYKVSSTLLDVFFKIAVFVALISVFFKLRYITSNSYAIISYLYLFLSVHILSYCYTQLLSALKVFCLLFVYSIALSILAVNEFNLSLPICVFICLCIYYLSSYFAGKDNYIIKQKEYNILTCCFLGACSIGIFNLDGIEPYITAVMILSAWFLMLKRDNYAK